MTTRATRSRKGKSEGDRIRESESAFEKTLNELSRKHAAIVRCFRNGASVEDLSLATGYSRAFIEIVLRRQHFHVVKLERKSNAL